MTPARPACQQARQVEVGDDGIQTNSPLFNGF
jgi:hypothetical protein